MTTNKNYGIMKQQKNIFEKIKELLTKEFFDIDSNYRKRLNIYTSKDLEYFNGKAENVGTTCMECVALNNCVFYYDNLSKYEHPKCKCFYVPVQKIDFIGKMKLSKIDSYLMVKDKKSIFENLGYSIKDSENLKDVISKSALDSYKKGKYTLKNLDKWGQRLGIETKVFSIDKTKVIKFYSGWILYPNGKIINATPFGGWIKGE